MGALSTAEVARILGLPEARIREIARASPLRSRRRGRHYAFSFQDLVVLRAAKGLLEARVPAARVRRALAALSAELPEERPLSGLRIYADGRDVAVCDGGSTWQPETGQFVLQFEVDALADLARGADDRRSRDPAPQDRAQRALAEFERALELEERSPAAARAAYAAALALDPELSDAYVNLGCLVHQHGDAREATRLYREALRRSPDDPVIHFDLALALEDEEGPEAAAEAYERALALDPEFADAHFNLAGLCEQLGRAADALRHYRAYRDLQG